MDALIVGAGAVGRWFAGVLECPVAFADADPDAARGAAAALGDRGTAVELSGSEAAEVVVVAVPMRVATETISEQAPRAETAVVDLTGSMEAPLAAMNEAAPELERASFHPLFAPEHAPGRVAMSVDAAVESVSGDSADKSVSVAHGDEPASPIDRIQDRLTEAGNTIVAVDPETHDRAMQTIQGRAHAAILAFGLAAEDVPEELATPVFEELQALRERVTGGSPDVYRDIQAMFDGAEAVSEAATRLAASDSDEFEELYDDAG